MRAIGIIRQSKGSEEALSPAEQRGRIEDHCEREGLELVAVHEEIDVSGGTPLVKREGLRGAVEAVEAGDAEVVLVAYFDRLVRSLRVQDEVVSRVEEAGGRVVAIDFGRITEATAAQWLSGTMIGAVSEYYRRSVRERAGEAQAMAVARGVCPFPSIPPGYVRGPDGVLAIDATNVDAVRRAFLMRVEGARILDVRTYLREQGIERTYRGVQSMLGSRLYLGEIHFGELVNLHAHEPLIERELWKRVQAVKVERGPRASSDRLLARLGVLRCGTCNGRMSVGTQTQNGRSYAFYRCSPTSDCPKRTAIGAEIAETFVVEHVQAALADVEGRASAESEAQAAALEAERDQANLDSAIRAFADLTDEPAAVERLRELRNARDASRERAEHLSRLHSAVSVRAEDWDALTLEGRRALIRASVESVTVGQGRGRERLTITFR